MSNPFDDFADQFTQPFRTPGGNRADLNAEKGCPLRGRQFEGVQYVRLEDVVTLLKINDVLPKAQAQFGRRV